MKIFLSAIENATCSKNLQSKPFAVHFMNNDYIAPKQESFIWVARDPDIEDRYSDSQLLGKLTAFYDTPIYCFNGDTGRQEWCRARKIGDLPSYMFPDISFKNSPVKFKQISE